MKVTALLTFFAVLVAVAASSLHAIPRYSRSLASRHAPFIHRSPSPANLRKRCKTRPDANKAAKHPTSSSPESKPKQTPKPKPPPPPSNSGGVLRVQSDCGPSGATKQPTKTTGPNGSIDFLNCGINSGGWRPPHISASNVIFVPLSVALQSDKTPFKACSKYLHLFEKYANQHGLPPILLAAFAMQESSCNENEVGGGGEQGLMQITRDKCGGAPGGNCREPDFNIRTAANYFAATLNNNGGNLLLTAGMYNGWSKGLTYAKATAAKDSPCCTCQNNLDYQHQLFNGWLQNIDPRAAGMGKYFNLEVCH